MHPKGVRAGLAVIGAVAAVSVAYAQPATTATAAAQSAAADNDLTEITITGSRVITNGNDAPTPVTVVNPAQLMVTKPTTIFDNLATLPEFSGSRGASSPVGNSPNGQGAVSSLNLRNLGSQRELVLFDGHRVPPATPDGLVDINELPQMLIQRVDVVTGGVSAVYGSDAVTGVVNFITDTKFNGLKVNVQRGWSTYNDDDSYDMGLAAGHSLFSDRGHVEISAQRRNQAGLKLTQRAWAAPDWTLQGNGSTIPYHLQAGVHNITATYGGDIVCGSSLPAGCTSASPASAGWSPLVGNSFNQNGVLSPFQHGVGGTGVGLTATNLELGGNGYQFSNVSLMSSSRLDQLFGRFDFDVTDNIHFDIVGSGSDDRSSGAAGNQRTFGFPNLGATFKLGSCNAFLASQYQQAEGCTNANDVNQPTFRLAKIFDPALNYGIGQNNLLYVHNYYVMADLNGKFGADYRWDAAYTHGQDSMNIRARNLDLPNMAAALDAVVDPTSQQIVCRVTITNPSAYPGCVPIDMFGPTSTSLQAINYVYGTISNTTINKVDDLSASVTGSPLNDWAGPIDMALSGEYRSQTLAMQSSSLPASLDPVSCVGLLFNCGAGMSRFVNNFAPLPQVKQGVTEGALEFNAPLLKDWWFVKGLNFSGAARYTRYSNNPNNATIPSRSFNATTWKAGLVWDINDQLTLRWARSRDFRAPNLYELYNPVQVGAPNFVQDLLTQQQDNPRIDSGGNPYLKPEVAHTTTLGLIYRPTPQWNLALDGFDITIVNAMYALTGTSSGIQQACINSGGSSSTCGLFRWSEGCCSTSPTNKLTDVFSSEANIAVQKTWGADFETNYNTHLFDRALSLRALTTYQPHILYQVPGLPGKGITDTAGVAYSVLIPGSLPAPVWRVSGYAHYDVLGNWALDLGERWRSRLAWSHDAGVQQVGGVASVAYTDLTATYDMPIPDGQLSAFFNVQNVFNKAPPAAASPNGLTPTVPGGFLNGWAVGDDVVGRYFTVGLRARL